VKVIWVAPDGNDGTATGSREKPYLTIEAAMTLDPGGPFQSGDQIRLAPGTYTPADALIFNGVDGSIMSDIPGAATIQPVTITGFCSSTINIISTLRFSLYGLKLVQATDPSNSYCGVFALGVADLIIQSCIVSDFVCNPGGGTGIFVFGCVGKVNDCLVENFTNATTGYISGIEIRSGKIDIVGNHANNLVGLNGTDVYGFYLDYGTP
jgi:hypothetical protein